MAPSHHNTAERRCCSSNNSNPMPSSRTSSRRCLSQRRPMNRGLKSLLPLCYLMATMSCWTSVGAGWQDDIQPRRSITLGKLEILLLASSPPTFSSSRLILWRVFFSFLLKKKRKKIGGCCSRESRKSNIEFPNASRVVKLSSHTVFFFFFFSLLWG